MSKLNIINHPLIENKISMLRNKDTGSKEFRELVEEIAMLICYEATRDANLTEVDIESPLGPIKTNMLVDKKYGVVPILRAGIGMVDGILKLMPTAKVGHIGLYRDPVTLKPVEYYCKLPVDAEDREIFLIDPMLATGGTSSAAIEFLKEQGVKNIKLLCLIASPEAVERLSKEHNDVDVYTAAYDKGLNEKGYIIPGLGDAGDRLYGTK